MKRSFLLAILLCLGTLPALAQTPAPAWSADLNEIRHVAAMIPGFISLSISKWLRAGGALAVFAAV